LASADVPMIYASTLASIAKDNELFFRDYFDTDSLGTGIAQKVAKEGHKRIGYIGEKSDSCAAYLLKVKEVFDGQGISIVSEQRFAADENDLKTYLLKIKDTRPDAIVTCSNRKSDIFMRQMNQIGMIGVQSFQTHAPFLPNGDTQEIRSLYEKNKSVSTWYGFAQGSLNEKQVAFKKRYEEKFKIKLVPDAAFAYDDVMVSATAMKECFSDGGLNNRCFLENLAKTNSDGVSGRLKFNEFRSSERETILIQVVNGEWVQVR
jgi:ABC-type branched-subunit amino acid transport system substrate-binding protein